MAGLRADNPPKGGKSGQRKGWSLEDESRRRIRCRMKLNGRKDNHATGKCEPTANKFGTGREEGSASRCTCVGKRARLRLRERQQGEGGGGVGGVEIRQCVSSESSSENNHVGSFCW